MATQVARGGADGEGSRAPTTRRIVIVDDHRTFVELLSHALDGVPGLQCVGTAYDPDAGLTLVARLRPDLVVMDYEFPGHTDGLTAAAQIRARFPDVHVVVLTGRADPRMVQRAAEAGASSLLPKDGSLPELLEALKHAGAGGLLVHPKLILGPALEDQNLLSRRELEVLTMLAVGLTATEIAEQLGITRNTCRGYIKSVLWKLGAHTQLEAVALARRKHLVTDP
ncbi:response regulator [Nocardioides sp. GCM10027113]|uniref:response regulator n=1 Tax=unclassified Nocardioides TaxID=2615069 RepID=UPI003618DD0B